MAVTCERSAALRTDLFRQIEAGADLPLEEKFGIAALFAVIMRRKRIDLGNARHAGDKGGADRASGADQIAVVHRVFHELLRDHVQNGKAMGHDRRQLLIQTL